MTTRRSTDDGNQLPRCGAGHASTTVPAGCADRVPHVPPAGARRPVRTPDATRGVIEQLRQAAVYVETAAVLERRAGSAEPALAALLRERAEVRRRTAERLRAALAAQRPLPRRLPAADRERS